MDGKTPEFIPHGTPPIAEVWGAGNSAFAWAPCHGPALDDAACPMARALLSDGRRELGR